MIIYIQYLRAVAVLSVFIYHSLVYGHMIRGVSYTPNLNYLGESGVEIFFVVSGFIMMFLVTNRDGSKYFLRNRLIRIYPTFFITCAIVTIVQALRLHTLNHLHLESTLKVLSLLPFQDNKLVYILAIEWTLIYEVMFYVFTSLFLAVSEKYIFFFVIWFIGLNLANILIPNFGQLTLMRSNLYQIFFSNLNLLFCYGAFSYFISSKFKNIIKNCNIKIHPIFVILIASAIVWLINTQIASMFIAINLVGMILFICIIILSGSAPKRNSFFESIGNFSYGIYLIHAFLISLFYSIFNNLPIIALAVFVFIIAFFYGKFEYFLHGKFKKILTRKQ